MISLLGALLGLVGAILPELVKMFQDRQDKRHELALLEMQMQAAEKQHTHRMQEIETKADIAEIRVLHKNYNVGVRWVDALNGTVRPVIAYAFFLLYAAMKGMQAWAVFYTYDMPLLEALPYVWTVEDQGIFAGIIAFYFGQRGMRVAQSETPVYSPRLPKGARPVDESAGLPWRG